jgi:hypothetical protein
MSPEWAGYSGVAKQLHLYVTRRFLFCLLHLWTGGCISFDGFSLKLEWY